MMRIKECKQMLKDWMIFISLVLGLGLGKVISEWFPFDKMGDESLVILILLGIFIVRRIYLSVLTELRGK
jgi:hypothetical protein